MPAIKACSPFTRLYIRNACMSSISDPCTRMTNTLWTPTSFNLLPFKKIFCISIFSTFSFHRPCPFTLPIYISLKSYCIHFTFSTDIISKCMTLLYTLPPPPSKMIWTIWGPSTNLSGILLVTGLNIKLTHLFLSVLNPQTLTLYVLIFHHSGITKLTPIISKCCPSNLSAMPPSFWHFHPGLIISNVVPYYYRLPALCLNIVCIRHITMVSSANL